MDTVAVYGSAMEPAHERLQRALKLSRYETIAEVASVMGAPYSTIAAHFNGGKGFRKHAERYAALFGVDLGWLITGKGQPRPDNLQARILSLSSDSQRSVRDLIEMLEERERHRRQTTG